MSADDALVEKVAARLRKIQHRAGLMADVDLPNHFAEAALAAVRTHEAGIAAAVEELCDEAIASHEPHDITPWVPVPDLRAVLTDTGAAEAFNDALAEAWEEGNDAGYDDYPGDLPNPYRAAEVLRKAARDARADRIEADNA